MATIRKVLSLIMTTVLDVTVLETHDGPPTRCVLKLYDRRFGEDLRSAYDRKVALHTLESEAAFQTFVISQRAKGGKRRRREHPHPSSEIPR
jgi:hypothetical protein